MAGENNHVVLFEKVDFAAAALDVLREHGLQEEQIEVLSAEPHSAEVLGRPQIKTMVPWIGMTGFLVGLVMAFLLVWGTPQLYPISVGGRPLFTVPPWLVLTFEFSMLGLLVATFLGVIWESNFPDYRPKVYHPGVSEGEIGIVFNDPSEGMEQLRSKLTELGGRVIEDVEERKV